MSWDPFAPAPQVRGKLIPLCPEDPIRALTPAKREALRKARAAQVGQEPRGERNGAAKLNATIVRRIRIAYAAGARPVDLARRYNVERTLIWYIVRRRIWTHV